MAEEFQTGVCGGNWWMNSSRSVFTGTTSPCSLALSETGGGGGGYAAAWSDMVDMKGSRSCTEDSVSDHHGSLVFSDVQKPPQLPHHDSSSGSSSILIDSTLQMMGFGFSSSSTTSDLNQALLRGGTGRTESNYNSMLQDQDMNSRLNYQQERSSGVDHTSQIQKNWSPTKNFSNNGSEDLSITSFKSINQDFPLVDTVISTSSTGFPVGSVSYGYPSTLVQSLFDSDSQSQQSLFNNNRSIMSYSSTANNYGTNSNELSPSSWTKLSAPFYPKQQPACGLHFSNKTPFWNASTVALTDTTTIRPGFHPSSQSQYLVPTFEEKPKCSNLTTKPNMEDVQDSVSVVMKKSSSSTTSTEPVFKRPRIETPSPLPTFKVRKEKLGDRITALQQLVSPFGKTDTASVLHEAIEYIKFLHDQVSVLSTPYMKNGTPIDKQYQQGSDKLKDSTTEGPKQDLRSRGLCLVPISSTYPVANETTADFWTPTFGGTFR
ncbi:transcription factor bHLH112 isoform X1 [Juglans microcarpa x Juglans regia]|uniref:transcription factor bHLH112 isoform X1 n=1 Tax=Juglans microcarpa x Juglans regia TaxID=2249226 RepID=UPI001B7F47C9|nr:transcription factor bHLH112 isoform X1 [Juglans microcarpa x Juglans regia]